LGLEVSLNGVLFDITRLMRFVTHVY